MLSMEDSWPPRLMDTDQHTARLCQKASDEESPHRLEAPRDPGWPIPPPWQRRGVMLGSEPGHSHTTQTRPKGCELGTRPLG